MLPESYLTIHWQFISPYLDEQLFERRSRTGRSRKGIGKDSFVSITNLQSYVFEHIQFFVSLAVSNIKKLHLKDFSISFSFFYSHLFVSAMIDAKFLLSFAEIFSPEGRTTTKLLKISIVTFCPAIWWTWQRGFTGFEIFQGINLWYSIWYPFMIWTISL